MSKVEQTPTTPPAALVLAILGQGDPRMVEAARLARELPADREEAWLQAGDGIVAGMPVAEAERLMWREVETAGEG